MDRTYAMYNPAGAGDALDFGEMVVEDKFFKRCDIPVEYNDSATTGVISTMTSNNIGVLALASNGDTCSLDSVMRIRYTDN